MKLCVSNSMSLDRRNTMPLSISNQCPSLKQLPRPSGVVAWLAVNCSLWNDENGRQQGGYALQIIPSASIYKFMGNVFRYHNRV